ncbi:DNA alkylation repair protein [Methanosarcina sp. KYL-1]|uniref:DNA alkylation repair protein n=1 Tax=Methanosarcina sp. KYL-1 TaxID=2602068 RepID=UPI002101D0DF
MQSVDEKTKSSYQRFFKEEVKCYGVKSAAVGKVAKKYFKEIGQESNTVKAARADKTGKAGKAGKEDKANKKEVFFLCEELLESDYCEEAFIAFEWAYLVRKDYSEDDFPMFERWIEKYVNNWAKCDTLCNHAVGSFIEQFPAYVENLKAWTKSDNRWLRRAAAVSLVLPARRGNFLSDIFKIADHLLKDEDDLVRKGYGWMLKEASKPHQQEVFEYVMKNKKEMPRTALRYAIEKLPEDLRARAMEKDS